MKSPNHLRLVEDHNDPAVKGEDIDVDLIISDEQLAEGGMVAVKSYMRTTKSKAALRKKKQAENDKKKGVAQMSLKVPDSDEHREAARAVATALRTDLLSPQEVLVAVTPDEDRDEALETRLRVCRTVLTKGGLRAWLLRRLL